MPPLAFLSLVAACLTTCSKGTYLQPLFSARAGMSVRFSFSPFGLSMHHVEQDNWTERMTWRVCAGSKK